ncbi:MAG: hypothetical protein GWN18_02265 [Thermoplasmata archaeon]|nr:hypothetical protein [Thermoplasmata archaeon]NIS10836.1 hypothetical protein [Thermoplasmata archaeon]NIS18768.1 hypothetical protein [Thermoplasmata archaeon]NIT75789.1 hypothetical protein [Thermoplasmata archaeon]NIU47930.1 hypothetical protein [Thermoplasmata archaeon]
MTPSTEIVIAILLLSLGTVSLALAYVAGRHSVRGAGRRATALTTLGIAALAGSVLILWGTDWSQVVDEMLWPLLVYSAAAVTGLGACATLVYALVAAR